MDEITDVAKATEPISEPQESITSYIDEEGNFKDGWRDFVPEDIRAEKVFDRAKSLEGVFKSLASAERKFGMKSIPLPNQNSKPEDWENFYKTLGRPEKAEEYKIEKDKDIPDEFWPEEIVGTLQKASYDAGVNPKQAAVYGKAFNEFLKRQINKLQVDKQLKYDESLNSLKSEWSGTYDANIHLGNIAFEKGTEGNSELREAVKTKFGSDPDFVKLMKNLGMNFKEGKTLDSDGGASATSLQIKEQMDELRNSDAYKNKMNLGHKDAITKMSKLYEQIAKIK